jgi:hypothetical protein
MRYIGCFMCLQALGTRDQDSGYLLSAHPHPSVKSHRWGNDDSMKEVILHAQDLTYSGVGDRHVLLQWIINAATETGVVTETQIVQLTGQSGNYSYYVPVAKFCSE